MHLKKIEHSDRQPLSQWSVPPSIYALCNPIPRRVGLASWLASNKEHTHSKSDGMQLLRLSCKNTVKSVLLILPCSRSPSTSPPSPVPCPSLSLPQTHMNPANMYVSELGSELFFVRFSDETDLLTAVLWEILSKLTQKSYEKINGCFELLSGQFVTKCWISNAIIVNVRCLLFLESTGYI